MSTANAKRLLDRAQSRGITLSLNGNEIVLRGPTAAMARDLLAALREHKTELRAELTRSAALPCPATIMERTALIENGEHCSRNDAQRLALAEHGFDGRASFASAQRSRILAATEDLLPENAEGALLQKYTRQFLGNVEQGSANYGRAIDLGWTLEELFGIAPGTRLTKPSQMCLGLIPFQALCLGKRGECSLVAVNEDHAVFIVKGNELRFERFRPDLDGAVVWWDHEPTVSRGDE